MSDKDSYIKHLEESIEYKDSKITLLEDKIKLVRDLLDIKDSEIQRYREALKEIGCELKERLGYWDTVNVAPEWLKDNSYIEPIALIKYTRVLFDRQFASRQDIETRLEIVDKALYDIKE